MACRAPMRSSLSRESRIFIRNFCRSAFGRRARSSGDWIRGDSAPKSYVIVVREQVRRRGQCAEAKVIRGCSAYASQGSAEVHRSTLLSAEVRGKRCKSTFSRRARRRIVSQSVLCFDWTNEQLASALFSAGMMRILNIATHMPGATTETGWQPGPASKVEPSQGKALHLLSSCPPVISMRVPVMRRRGRNFRDTLKHFGLTHGQGLSSLP